MKHSKYECSRYFVFFLTSCWIRLVEETKNIWDELGTEDLLQAMRNSLSNIHSTISIISSFILSLLLTLTLILTFSLSLFLLQTLVWFSKRNNFIYIHWFDCLLFCFFEYLDSPKRRGTKETAKSPLSSTPNSNNNNNNNKDSIVPTLQINPTIRSESRSVSGFVICLTHTHTLSLSLTLSHSYTLTLSLSLFHSLTLSHTLTLSHSHSHSLSLIHIFTFILILSFSYLYLHFECFLTFFW
jgi:hypothetical protein